MTSSMVWFDKKTLLNNSHNVDAQGTIVKRCQKDNFELRKSIFAQNLDDHFTLKISANQRFETCAPLYYVCIISLIFSDLHTA